MILETGFLRPTREQIEHVRKFADNSFCAAASENFVKAGFPHTRDWINADGSVALLKLKNVEPHDDVWVSRGTEPRVRRAIFWLMEGGSTYSGEGIFFGCGRATTRLKPGEFVVFNDKIKHWVMSDKVWRGAAVQLRKVKS